MRPLPVETDVVVDLEIVTLAGHGEVVVAVGPDLGRTSGLLGDQGRHHGEEIALGLLAAEGAAHTPHLDGDGIGRHPQRPRPPWSGSRWGAAWRTAPGPRRPRRAGPWRSDFPDRSVPARRRPCGPAAGAVRPSGAAAASPRARVMGSVTISPPARASAKLSTARQRLVIDLRQPRRAPRLIARARRHGGRSAARHTPPSPRPGSARHGGGSG